MAPASSSSVAAPKTGVDSSGEIIWSSPGHIVRYGLASKSGLSVLLLTDSSLSPPLQCTAIYV